MERLEVDEGLGHSAHTRQLDDQVISGREVAVLVGIESGKAFFHKLHVLFASHLHRHRRPTPHAPAREVFLLQRKKSKVGDGLGKTTGWIHRTVLKNRKVEMLSGVQYLRIDDEGLHIQVGEQQQCLPVDQVIICAGQEPLRELQAGLQAAGKPVHIIGGADVAAELDAKRAIRQGAELASVI
mgnify:CR=1 FL=1